ncbi:MAG: NUDIX hydrolase [Armatimonadota bacterium]|nr:NUDIX hydrolase [Armatimonadota bacterium]
MTFTFCPKCGARLEARRIEDRDRPTCPGCGFVHYNNALPCVGVLALKQGNVLLVKRAVEPFKGYWDIPGGFLESDEHPYVGAKREFLEETGLKIEPTEVLGFFMDIYGEDEEPTLNICLLARVTGGQERAGSDAVGLEWFPLDALPQNIAFNWEREALDLLAQRLEAEADS